MGHLNPYVVRLARGGPWDWSRDMREQERWDEHAAFMDALVDQGFVVLGGPLEDEYRVAHAIEAESPEAIRATLANDPWSGSHLVIESIDAWTIRLDGRER